MAALHFTLSLCLTIISLHFYILFLISQLRAQQAPYPVRGHELHLGLLRNKIRWLGLTDALLMLSLPYAIVLQDPLQGTGLRVACFFYACKTLDLAIAKVDAPPTRLSQTGSGSSNEPAAMQTLQDKLNYAWALATEMRYHSFDIAAKQKLRPTLLDQRQALAINLSPALVILVFAWLFPIAELKCAALLLAFQCTFETLHCLLHPRCPHWLCYRPFAAGTMSDFWGTHWHACAEPFLRSLAFTPTKRYFTPIFGKEAGSALGVLAAFSLSGIWHGWASGPLVTRPLLLGVQVWALFVAFGVMCMAERWIWARKQGGLVQRSIVWGFALCGGAQCYRTMECYAMIEWFKSSRCGA
ncbi:hypothetical protein LTR08_004333 [Meristemomyces frigidus]|nr:hypothetical protein LTR08_004333 [Meristemomyces frigidus]